MLQGKRTRKSIAATFLVVLLTNTLAPTVTYALTSGPTAPEATSFEPIDTTDMVNLQSGDFTYNIPLIEVPGPEGGYPLALSYHASIQPNEDASWVGLGFSLNPGSITRNINGYPDDWYNPTNTSHVYWAGGTTTTYNVGVSIGIANAGTVGAGLSFSQDTYQGFGIGGYVSFSAGAGPVGGSISLGISPQGDAYLSGGLGVGTSLGEGSNLSASAGIGFQLDSRGLNAGVQGGINASEKWEGYTDQRYSTSLLGASISTGSGKPSVSIGGLSATVSGTKQAGIQTSSSGFSLDIPIVPGVNVSLGASKTRYWTNETTTTNTHGSIYMSDAWPENPASQVKDNDAFDSYSLLQNYTALILNPDYTSIITHPDPTRVQGGAFPDYDLYNVNAQGLSGSIRPYVFQGQVLGQNKKNNSNAALVTYYSPTSLTVPRPEFRFVNDFSNSYRQNYPDYASLSSSLRTSSVPFDGSAVYGDGDPNFPGYYNSGNSRVLVGSKSVNINQFVKPSNSIGYSKAARYKTNMIEGFSITNESGVTYHYGLPAYAYDEEVYQEKIKRIDPNNVEAFNRQTKSEAYAYTWYLTSITGPDYVERDNTGSSDYGKASANDWGYWINFEYGQWAEDYVWRNPSEGYHRDEDGEWKNCSMGKKEIYYLNTISTRTHKAIFEKGARNDAKGAMPQVFSTNTKTTWSGFIPPVQVTTKTDYLNSGGFNGESYPSLKLNKIYLLKNEDVPNNLHSNGPKNHYITNESESCTKCSKIENIIDWMDIDTYSRETFESKALKVIDFTYDYSLCNKTTNSFDYANINTLTGKLTLKKINSRGRAGVSLLPPTLFSYELEGDDQVLQNTVTLSPTEFVTTNGNFQEGDLINNSYGTFCGVITKKTLSGSTYTYLLANSQYVGMPGGATVYTTKNPPYNKDAYDSWGLYKSDISSVVLDKNENLARRTSKISSKSLDVWSLRKIKTGLGTEIAVKYESDSYSRSVLNSSNSYIIKPITGPPNTTNINFKMENYGIDITDFNIEVGKTYPITLMCYYFNSLYGQSVKESGAYNITITNVTYNSTTNEVSVSGSLDTGIPAIPSTPSSPTQYNFLHIITGNIWLQSAPEIFGGGLRVQELKIFGGSNDQYSKQIYSYVDPNMASTVSSGYTAYAPSILPLMDLAATLPNPSAQDPEAIKWYKKLLYRESQGLYTLARELPSPAVLYEYVSVGGKVKNTDEQSDRDAPGKTVYRFEVFKGNTVGLFELSAGSGTYNSVGQDYRSLVIKKFTSGLGSLKQIIKYDVNNRKVTETLNHYLHDGLETLPGDLFFSHFKTRLAQYLYQGYLQERFSEVKEVENSTEPGENGVKATLSAREEYPCIQTGQTVINYANGTRTSSENLAFDFYSGSAIKTVETDAYGNRIMTEVVPAYRKYTSMGMPIPASPFRKNMLVQSTGEYTYKVDGNNNKLGLISANVETWSNAVPVRDLNNVHLVQNTPTNGDIWRMESSYEWMPVNKTSDGITPIANFSNFDYATPTSSNANWQKVNQISLYDPFSKGLEQIDINGVRSANRFNYGNKKIILSGTNCKYFEIAFGDVEDNGINQTFNSIVKKGDGIVTTTDAHTGLRSLKLGVAGKKGLLYSPVTNDLTIGRDYVAMVWVKPVSGTASDVKLFYDIDGVVKGTASSAASTKTANGWTLVTLPVSGADIVAHKTLTFGCINDHATVEAYVDDIRFQPLTATTIAYVYDSFSGELTYVLDNNNLYTKYEYDASGRLTALYREKLGIGTIKTNEYVYNMGQPLQSAIPKVYTKVVYDFVNTASSGCTRTHYYNVYIKFYSDAARTIPISISNITFNYTRNIYTTSTGATVSSTYSASIGPSAMNQHLVASNVACYSTDCNGVMSSRTSYVVHYKDEFDVGPPLFPIPPPAPPLYAKMIKTYNYSATNGCYQTFYYHIDVNFYSDAACTVPQAVNGFAVPFNENGTQYTQGIGSTPVSSVRLRSNFVINTLNTCTTPYTSTPGLISLVTSSNYTIVP